VIILGFFVVPSLGYYFVMKAFRRQQAFTAYRTFKEVFIPTLQTLARSDSSFIHILNTDFPKHEEAMRTFVVELEGDTLSSFNKKWAEYKQTYEKWGNLDSSNPNAIFAENVKTIIDTFKKTHQNYKGGIGDVEEYFKNDIANKKYIESMISDILKISKKY
jgi:hypothetical protein